MMFSVLAVSEHPNIPSKLDWLSSLTSAFKIAAKSTGLLLNVLAAAILKKLSLSLSLNSASSLSAPLAQMPITFSSALSSNADPSSTNPKTFTSWANQFPVKPVNTFSRK
jgi:hypothetical protein